MKNYFFTDENDNQIGPLTIEELISSNISRHTLIWHEGLDEWQRADKIEELKPLFAPPPVLKKNYSLPPPPVKSKQGLKKKNNTLLYTGAGVILTCMLVGIFFFFNHSKNIAIEQAKEHAKQVAANIIEAKEQEEKIAAEIELKNIEKQNELEKKALGIKMKELRNKWFDYIYVERSSYTYSNIGGIYNLDLIFVNKSEYTIDYAVASISYLKANGEVFKTETVQFENIPPKSIQKRRTQDSNRGTSVSHPVINSVISNQLRFCYSEYNWQKKGADPNMCD